MRVMALDLRMKNGFWAISFEYISVLDSYFIQRDGSAVVECLTRDEGPWVRASPASLHSGP